MSEVRRLVVLDWDGTLVDGSEREYQTFSFVLDRLGVSNRLPPDQFWSERRKSRRIVDLVPSSRLRGNQKLVEVTWLQTVENPDMLALDRLFPHCEDVLKELSRESDLYLCTLRQDESALRREVASLGVNRFFTGILVGSPLTHRSKAALVRPVLETSHSSGRPAIIGDTEVDLRTGKELGMWSVAVTYGTRSRQFLRKLKPDALIDDIRDLPGALR